MAKRRFTSVTRGIHDFGELGSHMGHGKAAVGAVGHDIASDFSVRFPISHMGISAATFKAAESMVRKRLPVWKPLIRKIHGNHV